MSKLGKNAVLGQFPNGQKMSLFYDPVGRKPKVWTFIAFVVVPCGLVFLLLTSTKPLVEKHQEKKKLEAEKDIFKLLDKPDKR
jgi:hypothetical protein